MPTQVDMKFVDEFFVLCFFLCGSCAVYTDYHDAQTLPRAPDVRTGHVLAENIHGTVIYRTNDELWISRGLYAGMFGIALTGGLVQVRARRQAERKAAEHRSDDRF
jgi:hypothetical protein